MHTLGYEIISMAERRHPLGRNRSGVGLEREEAFGFPAGIFQMGCGVGIYAGLDEPIERRRGGVESRRCN